MGVVVVVTNWYVSVWCLLLAFFFFQAEDGIRDYKVTGVQTCALPISERWKGSRSRSRGPCGCSRSPSPPPGSEERRVGKECRARWAPHQEKQKHEETSERKETIKRHSAQTTGSEAIEENQHGGYRCIQ